MIAFHYSPLRHAIIIFMPISHCYKPPKMPFTRQPFSIIITPSTLFHIAAITIILQSPLRRTAITLSHWPPLPAITLSFIFCQRRHFIRHYPHYARLHYYCHYGCSLSLLIILIIFIIDYFHYSPTACFTFSLLSIIIEISPGHFHTIEPLQ